MGNFMKIDALKATHYFLSAFSTFNFPFTYVEFGVRYLHIMLLSILRFSWKSVLRRTYCSYGR